MFGKYGEISRLDLKAGGFAFLTFENEADAEKAYDELKDTEFQGAKMNVEWANKNKSARDKRDTECFNCRGEPCSSLCLIFLVLLFLRRRSISLTFLPCVVPKKTQGLVISLAIALRSPIDATTAADTLVLVPDRRTIVNAPLVVVRRVRIPGPVLVPPALDPDRLAGAEEAGIEVEIDREAEIGEEEEIEVEVGVGVVVGIVGVEEETGAEARAGAGPRPEGKEVKVEAGVRVGVGARIEKRRNRLIEANLLREKPTARVGVEAEAIASKRLQHLTRLAPVGALVSRFLRLQR